MVYFYIKHPEPTVYLLNAVFNWYEGCNLLYRATFYIWYMNFLKTSTNVPEYVGVVNTHNFKCVSN
jgi:hypothetical protein